MKILKRNKGLVLHKRFLLFYRKNTLALFLSFALTFMLASAMLVLIHTNHKIANIEYQTIFSPSDCYISGLSWQQTARLKSYPGIAHLAVMEKGTFCSRNGHDVSLQKGDSTYITMMSKVMEGRLPEAPDEAAAEKWVLLNLGIEPVVGQEFKIRDGRIQDGRIQDGRIQDGRIQDGRIQDGSQNTRTLKLTGILSDMRGNETYGVLNLYTVMEQSGDNIYTAYIQLKDSVSYDTAIKDICSMLEAGKKQVHKSPAREDYHELYQTDVQISGVILFVCLVVFYGIYRIVLMTREKTYGILHAVGMERTQMQSMILKELYQIYFAGAPIGIAGGILLSLFILKISGDSDVAVYLYNSRVRYAPSIPVCQIALFAAVMAALIGATGYFTAKKIAERPLAKIISSQGAGLHFHGISRNYGARVPCAEPKDGTSFHFHGISKGYGSRVPRTEPKDGMGLHFHGISKNSGKLGTLFSLSISYLLQNLNLSAFVVLTVSTGVVFFTGLAYKAKTLETYREDTKEMWYINGQYKMGLNGFNSAYEGISRQNANEILNLKEIAKIKTAAGLPIRVIDEDGIGRNDAYYEEVNANVLKYNGYELRGHDGTDQIYKSILYGYNTQALKELEKYVVSGHFDAESLKEDEIILSILSTDSTKHDKNQSPGWYKDGTRLMQYHAGDTLTMKYRADFQTEGMDYETLKDSGKEYIYKTYKIAAIVSFDYMYTSRQAVYPLLVTSDEHMQKIVPDGCYQCIYIDSAMPEMTDAQQKGLERKLIRIGSRSRYVSTLSLISIARQNEMFYRKQMVYVYGMAATVFLLALTNMVNNLRYRMYARTREICMLRAIGLSVAMARKILVFENTLLGLVAVGIAYILSHPVLLFLYRISDMEVFGHPFRYDYPAFWAVSAAALLVCVLLSCMLLKSWKARQIMEGIGKAE